MASDANTFVAMIAARYCKRLRRCPHQHMLDRTAELVFVDITDAVSEATPNDG